MKTTEKNYQVIVLVNGKEVEKISFTNYESAVTEFQEQVEEKFGWIPQITHNPTNPIELQESEGDVDCILQFVI